MPQAAGVAHISITDPTSSCISSSTIIFSSENAMLPRSRHKMKIDGFPGKNWVGAEYQVWVYTWVEGIQKP